MLWDYVLWDFVRRDFVLWDSVPDSVNWYSVGHCRSQDWIVVGVFCIFVAHNHRLKLNKSKNGSNLICASRLLTKAFTFPNHDRLLVVYLVLLGLDKFPLF